MGSYPELEMAESLIASGRVATGRSCGSCSLCCKLLRIDDGDFHKPAGQWCEHCKPSRDGCSIYNTRPMICRGFACGWLVDPNVSDAWQPLRSKMVLSMTVNDTKTVAGAIFRWLWFNIDVDPGSPGVWRREPYWSQLRAWALAGLRGTDDSVTWTRVTVGRRHFIVLPDDEVEITGDGEQTFSVAPVGPDKWQVIKFKDAEQGERTCDLMNQVQRLPLSQRQQLAKLAVNELQSIRVRR
jgi:hypothetical protein